MLNDIRLDGRQLALLHHAAEVAGAELLPGYAGEFQPGSDRCIGLRATSPGQLVHFGALVAIALDLPDPLLLAMASRIQEDYPGNDARRVYYWPGILAAESQGLQDTEARRARHLVAVHCNAAALGNGMLENWELHNREHHGPGGIRNHPYGDLSYDEAKLAAVLAEAEANP